MKIYYKGFLCNLAPYRVMGEDRHALFPVTQSNDPIDARIKTVPVKWKN